MFLRIPKATDASSIGGEFFIIRETTLTTGGGARKSGKISVRYFSAEKRTNESKKRGLRFYMGMVRITTITL